MCVYEYMCIENMIENFTQPSPLSDDYTMSMSSLQLHANRMA